MYGAVTDSLRRELEGIVGQSRVSSQGSDLDTYARDMWPRLLLAAQAGVSPPHRPSLVVWPKDTREVAAVVRAARSAQVPIIPYGGGSGVCGGVVPIHGGITIDVKRLDRITEVSREEMVCQVEAGINGERFERDLNRRGYTFGHFPSSIYCSTVGGWLACRAAGQLSNKYGKVEDRVVGLTVVTGRGEVVETDGFARASRGPNWTQLIVGSEGTLGIITSARLRVSPSPELRVFRGFEFDDVETGMESIRHIMQRGLRPAVVRLYNEVDTLLHQVSIFKSEPSAHENYHQLGPVPDQNEEALPRLPDKDTGAARGAFGKATALLRGSGLAKRVKREFLSAALSRPQITNRLANSLADRVSRNGCKMIVGLEGARIRTQVEAKLTFGEIERTGGRDLGEEPGREWFEKRYAVSYGMSKVFRDGAFVDTMEVASTWDRLLGLYHGVQEAIGRHAVVMAHFSHAYPDGCSIYFTFAAQADSKPKAEEIYDAIWRDGMAAAARAGGTISHHHGVGLLKSRSMAAEHREAMHILRAVKYSLDPDDLMNPGKLGLLARGPERA